MQPHLDPSSSPVKEGRSHLVVSPKVPIPQTHSVQWSSGSQMPEAALLDSTGDRAWSVSNSFYRNGERSRQGLILKPRLTSNSHESSCLRGWDC